MPAVARLTDKDDSGSPGEVISATASSVIINGLPAAIVGSVVSPHEPFGSAHAPHEVPSIITGSPTVICEGQPLARVGDLLSCGHTISSGSPDVIVD